MRVAWRRTMPLLAVSSLLLAVPGGPAAAAPPLVPTAAVTSPTAGSQVAGFVSVLGTGHVDGSDDDTVQALQLYVDGAYSAQKSCSGSSQTCTGSFSWDTTRLYGTHALAIRVKTDGGGSATSVPVVVQVGDPPTASVDSPTDGSTVRGQVSIAASGTVDQLQPDKVESLVLLVDGSTASTLDCDGSDHKTCAVQLVWDSTGLSGQHALQARLTTSKGQTAVSAVTLVSVDSPLPSATITAPGAVVRGSVRVTVAGSVDASQADTAKSVALLVDGTVAAGAQCAGGRSCSAVLSWDSAAMPGQHQLSARVTTAAGRTGISAAVPVWVYAASKVSLAAVATTVAGKPVTVSGRVVTAHGDPIAGARVRVVARSSVGRKAGQRTVVTDATGAFAATYEAVSATTVTASVLASAKWSADSVTGQGVVTPAPVCNVKAVVTHGVAAPVSCRLGELTKGTAIALQVRQGKGWRTAIAARTAGATWTTSRVFATRGTYWLRVSVGASKDFTDAITGPVKVTVR